MKVSNATSARARTAPRRTGRSSGKPQRTPTAEEFSLSGPSEPPDPEFNAYRKDLADVALAGRVIASHYAKPLDRVLLANASLRSAPALDAPIVCELENGEPFAVLDESLGWAWGYAGKEQRVGYVPSGTLAAG